MTVSRRAFLGSLGAGLGGLLGAVSTRTLAAPPRLGVTKPARAMILLFMHGGASQIDTFDPKPGNDNGGEFRAIGTSVSGLRISEHLPGIAERMQHLALIRSLTSKEGNHERARYLMRTGFVPQGGVKHPGFGSVLDRARPPAELPGYVSIGGPGHAPGYLGAAHSAFTVQDPTKPVRNLEPPRQVSAGRVDRRIAMWRGLEGRFAGERPGPRTDGQRAVGERAISMVRSPDIEAFDLASESQATRARYGEGKFGQACLMARRLVERGVPCVEVSLRGWDTHQDNFSRVKELSGQLDPGMSALIDDLRGSGLWDETLIVWMGDFGRTPRINGRGGRDHFPRVSSVVMGGGPVRGGTVIGASSSDGMEIAERPVSVGDLFATIAKGTGVEGGETHVTPAGRPVTTVDGEGKPVDGILKGA